jgi:PAS domain S-box-containing protein
MRNTRLPLLRKYKQILIGLSIGLILSLTDIAVDLLIEKENLRELYREGGLLYFAEDFILFTLLGFSFGVINWRSSLYADRLIETEERYKKIVENSLTGIYLFQRGKFQYVNPRFSEILEYTPLDLIGMNAWDIIHPEDKAWVRDIAIKREAGEVVPTQYEVRAVTRSGKTVWVEIRAAMTNYKGAPAVFGNFIDITERKEKEETLAKQNATLQQAKKHLEDVLKNNCQIIRGYTEYIQNKKIRETLEDRCLELVELVENIDVFLTLRQATESLEQTLQNLDELLQKSVEYVKQHKPTAEIIIRGKTNAVVKANPYLKRALINLLTNALIHGNKTPITLQTDTEAEYVTISIENLGPPIPPERIKSLKANQNHSSGSGLGLRLATEIIEHSNGSWWVETEENHIDTHETLNRFKIKIPIEKQ